MLHAEGDLTSRFHLESDIRGRHFRDLDAQVRILRINTEPQEEEYLAGSRVVRPESTSWEGLAGNRNLDYFRLSSDQPQPRIYNDMLHKYFVLVRSSPGAILRPFN